MIFLTHNMVELDQLNQGIGLGVYGAITQFQALASIGGGAPESGPSNRPLS